KVIISLKPLARESNRANFHSGEGFRCNMLKAAWGVWSTGCAEKATSRQCLRRETGSVTDGACALSFAENDASCLAGSADRAVDPSPRQRPGMAGKTRGQYYVCCFLQLSLDRGAH